MLLNGKLQIEALAFPKLFYCQGTFYSWQLGLKNKHILYKQINISTVYLHLCIEYLSEIIYYEIFVKTAKKFFIF